MLARMNVLLIAAAMCTLTFAPPPTSAGLLTWAECKLCTWLVGEAWSEIQSAESSGCSDAATELTSQAAIFLGETGPLELVEDPLIYETLDYVCGDITSYLNAQAQQDGLSASAICGAVGLCSGGGGGGSGGSAQTTESSTDTTTDSNSNDAGTTDSSGGWRQRRSLTSWLDSTPLSSWNKTKAESLLIATASAIHTGRSVNAAAAAAASAATTENESNDHTTALITVSCFLGVVVIALIATVVRLQAAKRAALAPEPGSDGAYVALHDASDGEAALTR